MHDIYDLRFRIGGLTTNTAAALLHVDRRTFERWESGRARMPFAAYALLAILVGDLSPLGDSWSGWRFRNGAFLSPENEEITAGDLRALIFKRHNGMLYCLGAPHRAECPTQIKPRLQSVA